MFSLFEIPKKSVTGAQPGYAFVCEFVSVCESFRKVWALV